MKTIVAVLCAGISAIALLSSCEPASEAEARSAGRIEYEVTFPFNKEDMLVNLYPQKMQIAFSDDRMKAELKSFGGVIATEFFVDNDDKQFTQLLRAFNERLALNLDQSGVDGMLATMPSMKLTATEDVDTIAGYLCSRTIAEFRSDSVPAIDLWHTGEISISSPNWWNQFNGCEELLLGYDIEQFGMRMRLRATSVYFCTIPDDEFELPENYDAIEWPEMEKKLGGLIDQFSE